MAAPTGNAIPAGAAKSHRVRTFAVSFFIVAGGTVVGAVIGIGGALLVFALAEGEARGGPFVVAGALMMGGAGLGFVAGAVCGAWWLRKRLSTIQTERPPPQA